MLHIFVSNWFIFFILTILLNVTLFSNFEKCKNFHQLGRQSLGYHSPLIKVGSEDGCARARLGRPNLGVMGCWHVSSPVFFLDCSRSGSCGLFPAQAKASPFLLLPPRIWVYIPYRKGEHPRNTIQGLFPQSGPVVWVEIDRSHKNQSFLSRRLMPASLPVSRPQPFWFLLPMLPWTLLAPCTFLDVWIKASGLYLSKKKNPSAIQFYGIYKKTFS